MDIKEVFNYLNNIIYIDKIIVGVFILKYKGKDKNKLIYKANKIWLFFVAKTK